MKKSPAAPERTIIATQDNGNLKIALRDAITTIGREPGNDIQIRSRFVSRQHARIVSNASGVYIEDLGSRNGLTVNTQRVSRQRLRSGDFIRIGRTQLNYLDIMEHEFSGTA